MTLFAGCLLTTFTYHFCLLFAGCLLTTYACYAAPTTLKIRISNTHKMRRWGPITRVKRMPSKLVNNWSTKTNFSPTHLQPTPTGRAKFFARFSTFAIFFKNVPDYRNRSNFARGPNSTHSSIWEKKHLGVRKKRLIPYFQAPFLFLLSKFITFLKCYGIFSLK